MKKKGERHTSGKGGMNEENRWKLDMYNRTWREYGCYFDNSNI